MITPERLEEIRAEYSPDYPIGKVIHELVAEVDRLNEHVAYLIPRFQKFEKGYDEYKALLDDLNSRVVPGSIDTADSLVLLLNERDALKAQIHNYKALAEEEMRHQARIFEQEMGPLLEENAQLGGRVEKLREALALIAAPHLEPFCPELFDSQYEALVNDTMLARAALAAADDAEKGDG